MDSEMVQPPRLTEEEQNRADIYALFANLLYQAPNQELLTLLQALEIDVQQQQANMLSAWAGVKLAAQHTSMTSIEDEFYQLFIGLGRGELVPYASWYMTGMLMDTPLALLRQDLQKLGLQRDPEISDPEDHVASLCETMSYLITHPHQYSAEQQAQFFATHLAPWIMKFFTDLQHANTAKFYHSVGHLGYYFMSLEQQAFSMQR